MRGNGADCVGKLLAFLSVGYIPHTVGQAGHQVKPHIFVIGQIIALGVGVQQ